VSDQDLDLRASLGAIRRRRVLIGSIGLIGLAAGLGYGVAKPTMPAAITLVLLPTAANQPQGTPTADVATQVAIATSSPILDEAGGTITPPISGLDLRHQVHVSAESQNVLAIRAEAKTEAVAQRLADAVASDYIRYVTSTGSASTAGDVAVLASEQTQLTSQLKNLQNQINTVSKRIAANAAAKQQDATLLGTLQSEQTAVSLQLNSVSSEIVDARLNGALAAGTIRVLQPAAPVAVSKFHLVFLGGFGLIIGLLIGTIGALMKGRRDERLIRRNQIAAAVGAPVLASLEADQCKRVQDWHHLLERYQPLVRDAWNLQRILRYFDGSGSDGRTTLYVLSLADDRPALTVGPRLATYAASSGTAAALIPATHPEATLLRAACEADHRQERPELLRTYGSGDEGAATSSDKLTVITTVVNRDEPVLEVPEGAIVVLAVSSGFATADDMARVALAASDARVAVEGVVVVNPEVKDPTTGESSTPASMRRYMGRGQAVGNDSVTGRQRSGGRWSQSGR